MNKSFKSTLVMTAILAVLLTWFFVYEKKIRPGRSDAEDKNKQVVVLKADEVQLLEIERMKGAPGESDPMAALPANPEYEKIRLQKTGTDWNLTSPITDTADSAAVGNALSNLTSTKWERLLDENPKDLDQYGLKNPILKITVRRSNSAAPEVIKVGRNTPTGYGCYVMMGDKKSVYKASKSLRTGLDKDAKNFRNKTILSIARSDVGTIEIEKGKESTVLDRVPGKADKEEWTLSREHLPTETIEVQKTLNALVDAKAVDFVSEDGSNLAKFGLQKPSIKVTIASLKDKSRTIILLGKVNDKMYLKRDNKPIVYQVEKDTYNKLDRPFSVYRSMRLANFNRFDVQRIKVQKGKESFEFLRDDKGWSSVLHPQQKVDATKIDELLTHLQDIKITEYLPQTKYDVNNPAIAFQIFEKKDGKENEKVNLKFGNVEKRYMGVRRDLEFPFFLNEADFKKLNVSQKDFEIKEEPKKDGKDDKTPNPSKKT